MVATPALSALDIPERVTHASVTFLPLAGLSDLALITLDNGEPANRPNSFGLQGLAEIGEAVEKLRGLGAAGELSAVAITGKLGSFGAGADLNTFAAISERSTAELFLARGKEVFASFRTLGVPTFAFVNGIALGGGLEAALFCDYRTVASSVRALGQPEVYLGLLPGWGGTYNLPRLVGADAALRLIVDNPAFGNRLTTAQQAFELGIVDAIVEGDPADFVELSIAWAATVLRAEHTPARPDVLADAGAWTDAVERRRPQSARLALAGAPAVTAVLTLVANARTAEPAAAFALEEELCTDLLMSDTLRSSLYAFDLLNHRARHPAGVPRTAASVELRAIAVVGGSDALETVAGHTLAGDVPVTFVVPTEATATGVRADLEARCSTLAGAGRRGLPQADRLRAGLTVSTSSVAVGAANVVVLVPAPGATGASHAELLSRCQPDAVVIVESADASVIAAVAGSALRPERVVGWCADASAPLVQIVRTADTDAIALATAASLVAKQRRTAVVVGNQPGFVLDRVLAPLRQWVLDNVKAGMASELLDDVLVRFGLSTGIAALGLGGIARDAGHVTAPDSVLDPAAAVSELQDNLACVVADLLKAGTVDDVRDVDVVLLAGAQFPLHLGGIVPSLDRSGASERATGTPFLARGTASVQAAGTGY